MFSIGVATVVMLVQGSIFPGSPDVCLFFPSEISQNAPNLQNKGDYAVWVCAQTDVATFIEVGDKRYDVAVKPQQKENTDAGWQNVGNQTLDAGPCPVKVGNAVFMIALSRSSDFRPEACLEQTRVLPLPEQALDARVNRKRDTNTVFSMPRYASREAWEQKAELLRLRLLLGCGMLPFPEKTPLNAHVFDEVAFEDYAVSKVYFEAWPGFLVTGNLYRPLGDGPYPGVVNPHGHWEKGRLEDSDKCSVAARCITLARMGAVAFSYDMIGYVDSKQTAHNWGREREKLWGIHTFSMQLWSSVRAVDFLQELPYVDDNRIGCTGASGGGTQTFALTAIDPRVKVAAPVNMISSAMQGGCLCENAPLLRLDNSNMEIGAIAAPRPLLMVSATGDWTRETPRVEFPAIRSIYRLYDAESLVENVHLDYGHNYNQASREAMYRFMGKHLIGGSWDNFTEPAYVKPTDEQLRVFPGDEPPSGYLTTKSLVDDMVNKAAERRAKRIAQPDASLRDQNAKVNIFGALLGASVPAANALQSTRIAMEEKDGYVLERWVLGRAGVGDQVPALFYRSKDASPQDAVILVHGKGKAWLSVPETGAPGELVAALLAKGKAVLTVDAYLLGEHHGPAALRKSVQDKFHDTFQSTDTGHRVQDILTAAAFLRERYDMTGVIDCIGLESAGLWCVLAGAVDPALRHVLADLNQADFSDDNVWEGTFYVPGIRALGDLPMALYLGKPERFSLFNAVLSDELKTFLDHITQKPLCTAELTALIP